MYRVPSSRRQIALRRLKISLAVLLVLPALAYNGMAVRFSMRHIFDRHGYENHDLADLSIALAGIICSLAFVYGVARNWPRWKLFLGAGIILFTLACFAWDIYAVHVVY
ncbi:MAG TPA: hypothetical protein VD886_07935 [Herpetosiphonaceae bacterium]|nr:hypothetical protein [Herpetosiphonaceae bacterium]